MSVLFFIQSFNTNRFHHFPEVACGRFVLELYQGIHLTQKKKIHWNILEAELLDVFLIVVKKVFLKNPHAQRVRQIFGQFTYLRTSTFRGILKIVLINFNGSFTESENNPETIRQTFAEAAINRAIVEEELFSLYIYLLL